MLEMGEGEVTRPKLHVADLFCGAGGSSEGAVRALTPFGYDVQLYCLNHWELALESHRRMHPTASHICLPIEKARPRAHVPGGRLDALMASPSCTHHSRARGGRPTSDQQRADPWHILQWLSELEVDRLLIENVWEYVKWGPVSARTGKPIKSRQGEYFNAWRAAIDALGMELEYAKVNFANFGDGTTRERFVAIGKHRRLRSQIRWPEPTHAREPTASLRRWRSARECIDWSVRGQSIYGRPRELSAKTILRIHAGVTKFDWPERYRRRLERYMRSRDIAVPPARRIRIVAGPPAFILSQGEGGEGRHVEHPMPTIPCKGAHALIAPYYGSGSGQTAQSVDQPLPTITTLARLAFITSAFGERDGQIPRVEDLDQPLSTICAEGRKPLAQASIDDDDILYRMLLTHELARATSFTTPEHGEYRFAGNIAQVTRQIGNAVPIKGWTAHVHAAFDDLVMA